MTQHGDVVDGDDERDGARERRADARAVEHVDTASRACGEDARVPERGRRGGRRARRAARGSCGRSRPARAASPPSSPRQVPGRPGPRGASGATSSPTCTRSGSLVGREERAPLSAQVNRAACASPRAREHVAPASARRSPRRSPPGSSGIDPDCRVAAGLVQGRVGGDDARHAARHRLHHGHAEALEARRVDEHVGAAVQPRQLAVRDVAEREEPGSSSAADRPAVVTGDGQRPLAAQQPAGRDQRVEVLARLGCRRLSTYGRPRSAPRPSGR